MAKVVINVSLSEDIVFALSKFPTSRSVTIENLLREHLGLPAPTPTRRGRPMLPPDEEEQAVANGLDGLQGDRLDWRDVFDACSVAPPVDRVLRAAIGRGLRRRGWVGVYEGQNWVWTRGGTDTYVGGNTDTYVGDADD